MRKLTRALILATLAAALLVGVALAGYYTFCQNVYHNGTLIARVCTTWNISTRDNPDQVKANTNGTRTVQFFKSGYTALLLAQSCTPLQTWTTRVTCTSTTKFKQGGFGIGGIKMTCNFDANANMTCSVRNVLAPETK